MKKTGARFSNNRDQSSTWSWFHRCGVLFIPVLFLLCSSALAAPVESPVFLHQIKWTGTSWFGSPIIHRLGGSEPRLVGTYYSIYVWDKDFNELSEAPSGSEYPHEGRIYPPSVCADLDGDGGV